MSDLTRFTPRLDERLTAEFLAHSLALLDYDLRPDAAALDAGPLRFRQPEPPRDPDLPLLPSKHYPRPPAALIEQAVREMNPPPPIADFTGRKVELDRAAAALLNGKPALITGARGSGKTALLRQLAHDPRLRQQFRRIWWLDHPDDLQQVGITLGLALDAPNVLAAAPADQPAHVHDLLIATRTLLLIDSEFSAPEQVDWLLALTPHLALAAAAEPTQPVLHIALSGLPPEKAVNWLARLSGKPESVIAPLAALVDYHPGALRLLAALLTEDAAPPDAIAALLHDVAPDERLAALYAASFEALPEAYQALCRAFAASRRREIPVYLVLERFEKPLTAQRALTFIERRCFIERYEHPGPVVRAVGGWADMLAVEEDGGFEAAPRAAERYSTQPTDPDPRAIQAADLYVRGLALIDAGQDDEAEAALNEALKMCEAVGLIHAAAETLVALGRLAYLRGDDLGTIRRLERAAEHLHRLRDEDGLEVVRLALSRAYRRAGRLDAALSVLDDDSPPEDLTAVYRAREAWPEAIAVYQRWIETLQADEQADETADVLAAARIGLAETYILAGKPDHALALADTTSFAGRWIRALVRHIQGDVSGALADYTELQPDTPLDYRAVMARAMARAMAALGQVREAAMLVGAEGVWYEARLPRPVFARQRLSQALYAHLCLMLGQIEDAEAAARLAHALPGERPNPEAEAIACRVLARIAWQNNDLESAGHLFDSELTALNSLKPRDDHEIGLTLHNLAEVQRARGDHERAIANYRRALTHKDPARDRLAVARTRLALFTLLRQTGRGAEALEAGQSAVELLTQRSEADLHILGYAMANQARAQADFGRQQRASAMLEDWIARLGKRIAEGVEHRHWGVRVLAIGLFLRSDPALQPDPVTVIDMAEQALMLAEQHMPGTWPALAARRDLGQVYERLERWDDAREIFEPLVAAEIAPESEARYVALAAHLGMARAGVHLSALGASLAQSSNTSELLDDALAHFEAALSYEPDGQAQGLILREAAAACRAANDDERCATYAARALELLRRERDMPVYIDTVVDLAYTRLRLRRFGEAIDTFEEALRAVEQSQRPDPALLASVLHDMATAHFTLGQYRSASERFRQSLAHQDQNRRPERYAETLIAQARSDLAGGAYQGAAAAYHEALHFEFITPDLRRTLLVEQATAFAQMGQSQAALDAYHEALALEGGPPVQRAAIHRGLGVLYARLKQHARAQQHFEAVLNAVQDESTGLTLQALADTYRAQDQHKEAIDTYLRALDFLDRSAEPVARAAVERELGTLYLARGQFANAISHLERALEIERALPQQDGGRIVRVLGALAQAHEARGELERATLRYHEALVYQDARHAPESHIETLQTLGRLYTEQRRYGEAVRAYEEALRAEEKQPTQPRLDTLTVALAEVRRAQGQLEAAAELYQRAIDSPRDFREREAAREALRALQLEIDRHLQTLYAAEQSWALLSRHPSPDLSGLIFVRALQAQTSMGLGRREAAEAYLRQMFDLLAARREVLVNGPESPESTESAKETDHITTALSHLLAGWEHESAGAAEAAREAYSAALAALESSGRAANPALAWVMRHKMERPAKK